MSYFILICTLTAALSASDALTEGSPERGRLEGRSGAHVQYSADGRKSMRVLTSIDGLEKVTQLPFIIITTPEEVFGYRTPDLDEDGNQIIDSEGEPVFTYFEGDEDLKALYDENYFSPRGKFFAIPGGQDVSHIL